MCTSIIIITITNSNMICNLRFLRHAEVYVPKGLHPYYSEGIADTQTLFNKYLNCWRGYVALSYLSDSVGFLRRVHGGDSQQQVQVQVQVQVQLQQQLLLQ